MRRAMGWLLRLYPSVWRERYGAELEALLEDCKPTSRDIANVIGQAMKLRLSSPAFLKVVLPCSLAGLFVGLATSFGTPQFTSTTVMWFSSQPSFGACGPQQDLPQGLQGASHKACDDPTYSAAPLAHTWFQAVIDRPFLVATIEKLNLYPIERKGLPSDQVAQRMQDSIRLVPHGRRGLTSQQFDLQFSYPDAQLA